MAERGSKSKLFFILLILIAVVSIFPGLRQSFKKSVLRVSSPFMGFISEKTVGLRHILSNLFRIGSITRENTDLREELLKMESSLVRLEEARRENERLQRLLGLMGELEGCEFVAARVIGRDPSNWNRSMTINRGEKHGVKANAPVVSSGGLVGIVFESFSRQSKVMLLNDSNSRTGVIVERTRDIGVVEGQTSDALLLKYISKTASISVGDRLLTSGVGQIYPKGVKVGTITKVYQDNLKFSLLAEVKPEVDFGKLEEVLVVLRREDAAPDAEFAQGSPAAEKSEETSSVPASGAELLQKPRTPPADSHGGEPRGD